MYTPLLRIVIGLLAAVGSVFFFMNDRYNTALILLVSLALTITSYFRNGTVFLAFRQMKKFNIPKAKILLEKVYNPKWLTKGQRSYYYFVDGFIAMQEKDMTRAYESLFKSLEIGLRTENDRAIATFNLASVEFERGHIAKCFELISKTRALRCSPRVLSELAKLEDRINMFTDNL